MPLSQHWGQISTVQLKFLRWLLLWRAASQLAEAILLTLLLELRCQQQNHWETLGGGKLSFFPTLTYYTFCFCSLINELILSFTGLFVVCISTHSWMLSLSVLPTRCVYPLQRLVRQLAVTGGDALVRADGCQWNMHDKTKQHCSSEHKHIQT